LLSLGNPKSPHDLGLLTPWGLFTHWWVTIKLAIVAVLTGVVLFVLVPALGATADAVTGLTPRLLGAGERLPLLIAPATASTLLAVALVLAIFKPGWRTPWRPVAGGRPI
jgi:hypothetical protein